MDNIVTTSILTGTAIVLRSNERPLFAFHHEPPGPAQRSAAIVMCPPIGYESLSAYRTYRYAAEQLANLGFHVIRFDYYGTGNSAGDAGSVAGMVADVHAAVDELKRIASVTEVCLLGMRAGALLAAKAAAERTDVTSLVLMATPLSGRAYVREQRAFQSLSSGNQEGTSEDMNVAGFTFSAALLQELAVIDLTALTFPNVGSVLILSRDDITDDGKLLRHLTGLGCQVRQAAVSGYAAMMTLVESSVIPRRLLENLLAWSDEKHPNKQLRDNSASMPQFSLRCAADGVEVIEEAIRFGPERRMFGIVSRGVIQPRPAAKNRAVILLSVGANHHIGSGRLYVAMARELAAQGVTVLRFDVSGLGESYAAAGKPENLIYDPDSVSDVDHALRILSERYQISEFILVGVCFGAHLAFYAAVSEPRVVGQVLVNLAVFERQPAIAGTARSLKSFKARSYYMQAMFDTATWRRLFKGRVAVVPVISHLVLQSCKLILSVFKRRVYGVLGNRESINPVENDLRSVLRRGARTLLVYSEGDPALDGLALYLGAGASRVQHYVNFDMRLVSGADHTFNQIAAQRELRAILLGFVKAQT